MRDRLLDALEVVADARRAIIVDRGVDVPRAVGVDAQRHRRADRVAHRGRPASTSAGVAHLHLHRREAAQRLAIENGPSTSAFTGTRRSHRGREADASRPPPRPRRHTSGSPGYPGSGEHSPHPAGP